ncbi:MAG: insulinase family protein [Bacteroidales bacterium]|jgi:predicted Zn-dependent peptidase|nr:insulinase family protein [Bacteroidales bacterium]
MINRAQFPPILPLAKPNLTEPVVSRLDNGLPAYRLSTVSLPICKVDLLFNAGIWNQDRPLQASITNTMLQEGTQRYSSGQLADLFDVHGALLRLMTDQHIGVVSMVALTKHLPKLLPVLADIVNGAIFPEQELQVLLRRRKQKFLVDSEKVKILCHRKFIEALFGRGHPYAQSLQESDFEHINRALLCSFYQRFYHVDRSEILLSGCVMQETVDLLNEHFGKAMTLHPIEPQKKYEIRPAQQHYIFVEKQGAIQSAIRVGKVLVRKNHPDYIPLQILVTILGGYFSSRLMRNIRGEKGYTYGITASLIGLNEAGYLVISTEVDKSHEKAVVQEIFKEITRLCDELITEEELDRVRQYLLGELMRDFDGPFAQAHAFVNVHVFGLNYNYYEQYHELLLNISPEKLRELAIKYFDVASFYTVVAGRAKN